MTLRVLFFGIVVAAVTATVLWFPYRGTVEHSARANTERTFRPDRAFWDHWSDGKAELNGYDVVVSRYGEERRGTAVAIFVTETFSDSARVKADPGRHPESDEFPVMKLNLMQDFPTGVYDYNLMLSTFTALAERTVRAGDVSKVSFSSQEWCGHVYEQLLFDRKGVRRTSHSYFDGEADESDTLERPDGGIPEEALWGWARGWSAPILAPGESITVPCLRSLQESRLLHRPAEWREVRLERGSEPREVTVPAGSFEVVRHTARIDGGLTWEFDVEATAPYRIVRWRTSDGGRGELRGSTRMAYWQHNQEGKQRLLREFGLEPRPARTP